jgi:hypothetical protein
MSLDFLSLRLEALMQVKFVHRLPEEPDCKIQQPSETAEIGMPETRIGLSSLQGAPVQEILRLPQCGNGLLEPALR